jgi:phosphate transport system protein
MNDHLSKQFDLELENIRTSILQMGGLVEQQVSAAVDAFATGNLGAMQQVIENDREVDAMEVTIDENCTLLIARRQPTARDLRLVMAVSRIVTDLERVGDKAAKIARMSQKLYETERHHFPPLSDIRHCGQLALKMLQNSLDSLARMDIETARQAIREDAAIDAGFNGVVRQLVTYMMEDPRTISEALDIIWIAKAIERVGDHASNIAESVVYIISGVDIRHTEQGGAKSDIA